MPVMQTMPPLGFAHLSESSSDVVPISSSTCQARKKGLLQGSGMEIWVLDWGQGWLQFRITAAHGP